MVVLWVEIEGIWGTDIEQGWHERGCMCIKGLSFLF